MVPVVPSDGRFVMVVVPCSTSGSARAAIRLAIFCGDVPHLRLQPFLGSLFGCYHLPSFSIDVLSTSTLVLVQYVSPFLLALRRACALFLARRPWSAILLAGYRLRL